MYVLPKSLESAWSAARGKGYVMRTGELGEALVSGISTDHDTWTCSLTDSFFLFLSVECDWYGYGYGKRFVTLNRNSADHDSWFLLIRGHTSTTRTTCRVSLDVFCISLLAPTSIPCARACSWGRFSFALSW